MHGFSTANGLFRLSNPKAFTAKSRLIHVFIMWFQREVFFPGCRERGQREVEIGYMFYVYRENRTIQAGKKMNRLFPTGVPVLGKDLAGRDKERKRIKQLLKSGQRSM